MGSWPIFFLLQDLGSCPIFLYITNKAHNPYFSISWSTEHCACYFLFALLIDGLPNKSSYIHKNCLWTRDVQLLVIWHSLKVTHTHRDEQLTVGRTHEVDFFFFNENATVPIFNLAKISFHFLYSNPVFWILKMKDEKLNSQTSFLIMGPMKN